VRSVKNEVDPKDREVVYRINCEGQKVCIGQKRRSIKKRSSEHERAVRLGQTEKSFITEHWKNTKSTGKTRGPFRLLRLLFLGW
jgi:hypothetical protein